MLDPAMQQFADEMRTQPQPQRRGSTRRAEQVDNLSAPGAQRLSEMIRGFWKAAGFDNIRTEIVHSGGSGEAPVWGVRSNLIGALPPQGAVRVNGIPARKSRFLHDNSTPPLRLRNPQDTDPRDFDENRYT